MSTEFKTTQSSWISWTGSSLGLVPLAELQQLDLATVQGFTVRSGAFAAILEQGDLGRSLDQQLANLDPEDPNSVMVASFGARSALLKATLPDDFEAELATAYRTLSAQADESEDFEALVTVRPKGESPLEGSRVRGLPALRRAVLASYADYLSRAITADTSRHLTHLTGSVPEIVVSCATSFDCSGLMTTFETKTGNQNFVLLTSMWGLAEDISRKDLARDEYLVHKPTLRKGFSSLVRRRPGHKEFRLDFDISADRLRHSEVPQAKIREFTLSTDEVLRLSRAAVHYEQAMGCSVELSWGMALGWSRGLSLLEVHPVAAPVPKPFQLVTLTSHGDTLLQGVSVGVGLAVGVVRVIEDREDLEDFQPGEVLVTRGTEPDWEPYFRQACAIVTEGDTRVSHATILAREMGIPALLNAKGCSLFLETGQMVTVSCCEGDVGFVYEGEAQYETQDFDAESRPQLKASLSLSLSMPERALLEGSRPWAGVGLLRSEFLLTGWVRIHPLALLHPQRLPSEVQGTIDRLCRGYETKSDYFLDQMGQGIATIASAFWPRPVLLRLSDLKSHEYSKLVGGEPFEPKEANPAMGWRGAARYTHPDYQEAFALELAAIRGVRQRMGLTNLHVMIPFLRTPEEGEEVLELMAQAGLKRGEEGLEIWMMAELPSNVVLAHEFAEMFDGFSIGSNDLTQMTLGVDRDSELVADLFDEIHPAMMMSYERLLKAAKLAGIKTSFCGQVASADPLFAATLAEMGVDAISVASDAFLRTVTGLR